MACGRAWPQAAAVVHTLTDASWDQRGEWSGRGGRSGVLAVLRVSKDEDEDDCHDRMMTFSAWLILASPHVLRSHKKARTKKRTG